MMIEKMLEKGNKYEADKEKYKKIFKSAIIFSKTAILELLLSKKYDIRYDELFIKEMINYCNFTKNLYDGLCQYDDKILELLNEYKENFNKLLIKINFNLSNKSLFINILFKVSIIFELSLIL